MKLLIFDVTDTARYEAAIDWIKQCVDYKQVHWWSRFNQRQWPSGMPTPTDICSQADLTDRDFLVIMQWIECHTSTARCHKMYIRWMNPLEDCIYNPFT